MDSINYYRVIKLSKNVFLVLLIHNASSLLCPEHCYCDMKYIDCSMKQLVDTPYIRYHHFAPSILNLSFNNLQSVDELYSIATCHISVDLSFNRISGIPVNTFSGHHFVDLVALNLSGNSICDINFILPFSLQVLKIGRNALTRLNIGILRGLIKLQTLSLEMNDIRELNIHSMVMQKGHLEHVCPFAPPKHITYIYLQKNKLTKIRKATFSCFQNVKYMSLADNEIDYISENTFEHFVLLRYLDLSGNHLIHISDSMFKHLKSLKYLSLSYNHITSVPFFLPMLELLNLSHNRICHISETQKSDLYIQEVFLLGGNPFHCDCSLLWVKKLFDSRKHLNRYIQVNHSHVIPVCDSPSYLHEKEWNTLKKDHFACEHTQSVDRHELTKLTAKSETDKYCTSAIDEKLHLRVKDIGLTNLTLDWDGNSIITGPDQYSSSQLAIIRYHPFGSKGEKRANSVQFSTGTYTLHNLLPGIAYIVCLAVSDRDSSYMSSCGKGTDQCLEVMTEDDIHIDLTMLYSRMAFVILCFLVLFFNCCCFSVHRQVTSSH